jgi:hypothetical protein
MLSYSWKIKTRVEATNLAGTNKKTQKVEINRDEERLLHLSLLNL